MHLTIENSQFSHGSCIHQNKYPVQDDEYNYHDSCRRISKKKPSVSTKSSLVFLILFREWNTVLWLFSADTKPSQLVSCLQLFILQAAVVTEGVARWEDNKKWQQKVETLRGKLAEKTRELEKAEKTITMLRDAVSRAEKDKAGLHNRLKRCCFN